METLGYDETELEKIYEVEVEAWREDLAWNKPELEERLEMYPQGFLGIKDEGELKGFAYCIRYNYDELNPRTWPEASDLENHNTEGDDFYVVNVSVADQGEGYGKKLMEELDDYAEKLGVQRIVLGSRTITEGFYKKCGYERKEHIKDWWPEDEESQGDGIVMEKQLTETN